MQGNQIAAVGMPIAVVATLLNPALDGADFLLIAVGLAIGTAVGVPAARNVKMTAMPQMVALFNGVGGGAVALIAWAEFRELGGDLGDELDVGIPLVFAAIIGSISFWGSNIAFGKLQGLISGSPVKIPGGLFVNIGLLLRRDRRRRRDPRSARRARACSSSSSSRRRCSATSPCCRSAAPTCRSSSRRSTPSPASARRRRASRWTTPR